MNYYFKLSNLSIILVTVLSFTIILSGCTAKQPVDYVNPFIGSKPSSVRKSTDGRTHPGACVPFAMTKWTPANVDGHSDPYKYVEGSSYISGYEDTLREEIFSFRGSHYPNGSWMRDYGSYDFMPMVGELKFTPEDRSSSISHDREHASPGYYSVYLQDYKIDTEITATRRCGYFRFSFPDTNKVHILIDTRLGDGYVEVLPEKNRVIGYNSYSRFGRIKGYFVAEFSKEFSSYGVWDEEVFQDSTKATGEHVKAYLTFETEGKESIEVKVGTSFIDFEVASSNLTREIGTKTFSTVRREAREEWNEKLSRIEVEGGSEEDKIKFYTSLYFVYFEPRVSSSGNRYYSTYDEKIHETSGYDFYNDFSLWDTYRNKHSLLTYLEPKIEGDMIQSLVDMYKQGGWIPKWPNPGYSNVMIGTHATPVITEAYLKGIDNFEVEKAYEGMRKNAMVPTQGRDTKYGREYEGREGISYYKELGFVPADKERQATSKTLEFAFDDWALAQMAKALGKEEDYEYFMKRAGYYRNVIDTTVGFARGRNSDSSWVEPFDPTSAEDYETKGPEFRPRVNYPYLTEGTALHYTWHVQQDPQGLIELLGGKEKFIEKLEASLINAEPYNFAEWNPYYNQTNEPCMHAVYLFNYAGVPWKAQKWVRTIMDKSYGVGPAGMVGNDDVGTMSAWYIFSAMGFYPVAPGQLIYSLGSPVFDKVTIHLPEHLYGEKDFVIIARNNSPMNKYIQSASLNGNPLEKPWIEHSSIKNGHTLILKMGKEPNKKWGSDPEDAPPSIE